MGWMKWVGMTQRGRWGLRVLAVWLIATGLVVLFPALQFQYRDTILALLAVAGGVLLLLDR